MKRWRIVVSAFYGAIVLVAALIPGILGFSFLKPGFPEVFNEFLRGTSKLWISWLGIGVLIGGQALLLLLWMDVRWKAISFAVGSLLGILASDWYVLFETFSFTRVDLGAGWAWMAPFSSYWMPSPVWARVLFFPGWFAGGTLGRWIELRHGPGHYPEDLVFATGIVTMGIVAGVLATISVWVVRRAGK